MSTAGPIPSTLSDVLRYIVRLYVQATTPYAVGISHVPGDMVSSAGAVYVCSSPGTSAGAGPSGPGSTVDDGGVHWYPLFYTGERFEEQEGAPPRIHFELMSTPGNLGGPLAVSAREVAAVTETVVCRVWGAETVPDLDRYDAALLLCQELIAAFKLAAPGRLTGGSVLRDSETHLVTFGEQYQLTYSYVWAVPRSERLDAAAGVLGPLDGYVGGPPDPDRPNGAVVANFGITVTTADTRIES